MSSFRGWIANLSSGETVIEAPPVQGEYSSWRKLIHHCKETGKRVTGLQLVYPDLVVSAMQLKECSGYFQAYELMTSMQGKLEYKLQGIGSVVGDKVYITWVMLEGNDDIDVERVFQDVRPLAESEEHVIR